MVGLHDHCLAESGQKDGDHNNEHDRKRNSKSRDPEQNRNCKECPSQTTIYDLHHKHGVRERFVGFIGPHSVVPTSSWS